MEGGAEMATATGFEPPPRVQQHKGTPVKLSPRQKAVLQSTHEDGASLRSVRGVFAWTRHGSANFEPCFLVPRAAIDPMIRDGLLRSTDVGAGQFEITDKGRKIVAGFERNWALDALKGLGE